MLYYATRKIFWTSFVNEEPIKIHAFWKKSFLNIKAVILPRGFFLQQKVKSKKARHMNEKVGIEISELIPLLLFFFLEMHSVQCPL